MIYYQPFLGTQEYFYILCWPIQSKEPVLYGQSNELYTKKTE